MFKNITGFGGMYQVDINGKVRNKNKKIMKTFFNKVGYERITLSLYNSKKIMTSII